MTAAYSLRRRLLLWLLAATAALGLVALADTWREARLTAQGVSDRVLAGSALAIAERVTVDESGGLEVDLPYAALEMLTSTAQDQVFYRVDGPAGFLTGYDRLDVVAHDGDGLAFADATFGAVPIRVATLTRQVSAGDGSLPFSVTVAESTRARDELALAILARSALRLMGMILGAAAIVWVAVTLALRPLNRLGETIAQRSPDDLRPVQAHVPDEVQDLLAAVNSFMGRLDTALGALRSFTGNASHQLRTPLATVRTQLALARRGAGGTEALDKADAALARAERVLAQLLVLARVDAAAGAAAVQPMDLAELARGLTAEMVPAAAAAGIDLGYDGLNMAEVSAEPVLAAELLRNLLDNALAYAGRGATVTVRVRADTGGTVLEVEDDGPGLPPARAAHPLRRALEGVDAPQGGYGLGLAIVAEIAALFGAAPRFGPGPGGRGLRVQVAFPAS
ncbi:MAG TPA: sensor histidine kinase N-terminal domain-containing protein [Paracoccaceae bacterium]|nr:sensor histidine kinase N-terminal domain-containing protein [Paracoccaceae bacterium]